MASQPSVQLEVTLTTSSPTFSLSQLESETTFQLITTARIISSTDESSGITLCTDGSPLDNGNHSRHDGLFRGAFLPLESLDTPKRSIRLAFAGSPNYGRGPDNANLRDRATTRFETIPPIGEGVLTLTHPLTLERMFRQEHTLKVEDIKPGEKFRARLSPQRLNFITWWAFGELEGDLRAKKFARWQLPDKDGNLDDLFPGEEEPDIARMEHEGWVFSQRRENLTVIGKPTDGTVFEFVE